MQNVVCSNCDKPIVDWMTGKILEISSVGAFVPVLIFHDRKCAIEYADSWREEQEARDDELRRESAMSDPSDLD